MSELTILTIGDAHGRRPLQAKALVKKHNPDAVFCTGDLAYSDKIRTVIFSNWKKLKKQKKSLLEILGRKKHKELFSEAIKSMDNVLKYLNSLGKPIYLIYGNNDYPQSEIKEMGYSLLGIERQAKKYKNIHLMIKSKVKLGQHTLIGISGYRLLDANTEQKVGSNEKLDNSFAKLLNKSGKNAIVMYHDVPYKTKFDLVKNKASPMNGKHVGDCVVRHIITKYKPVLYVCGHMHENPGTIKMGKTICLNTGSVENKDYFIIRLNDKKVAIKKVK
ncbi:MAG TPA: metallophosphoesterase [Candidatus Nanoarchaeia archaeon]|nr:metallophosphoesterase [Candidatus Nanoarchaeia archaeon]